MFSIAICRHIGEKWQSKTLFLTSLDLRSSIVLAIWIAAFPVCSHLLLKVLPYSVQTHYWSDLQNVWGPNTKKGLYGWRQYKLATWETRLYIGQC